MTNAWNGTHAAIRKAVAVIHRDREGLLAEVEFERIMAQNG
jgi:hypothetical protein